MLVNDAVRINCTRNTESMAMKDRGMGGNVKGEATVVCLEVRIR